MTLAKFNIILGFEIDASILTEDYCWAKLGAYEGYTGGQHLDEDHMPRWLQSTTLQGQPD